MLSFWYQIFILIEDNCLKGQRQTSLPNRLVNFQIGTGNLERVEIALSFYVDR